MSALANRIVRPGATEPSDAFILQSVRRWTLEEERLAIELDAKTIAYALAQDNAIDQVMTAAGLAVPADNLLPWRHNTIYGLLWPRGRVMRRSGLSQYNPFAPLPEPERLLVAEFLAEGTERISLEAVDWREAALSRLAEGGTATLVCPVAFADRIAEALNFVATNPVQTEYFSVFARINALRRVGEAYEVDLEIAEFAQ